MGAVPDGSHLTVDVSGQQETVQYLGVQAPTGDACFASDATTANTTLVEGKQVWLERQATDRAADGALVRDVWIADANGTACLSRHACSRPARGRQLRPHPTPDTRPGCKRPPHSLAPMAPACGARVGGRFRRHSSGAR